MQFDGDGPNIDLFLGGLDPTFREYFELGDGHGAEFAELRVVPACEDGEIGVGVRIGEYNWDVGKIELNTCS